MWIIHHKMHSQLNSHWKEKAKSSILLKHIISTSNTPCHHWNMKMYSLYMTWDSVISLWFLFFVPPDLLDKNDNHAPMVHTSAALFSNKRCNRPEEMIAIEEHGSLDRLHSDIKRRYLKIFKQ